MSIVNDIKNLESDQSDAKATFMKKFKVALTFFIMFMFTLIIQSKYEITSEGLMLQQIPGIALGIFITLTGCAWSEYRKNKGNKSED